MNKLIRLELRKIFSKRLTQLAFAVVLLLSAVLSFSTYQNKYASDGAGHEGSGRTAVEIDKEIAARYSGVLTDEKVQQMLSEIVPKSGENGLNAIYIYRNTIQSAVSAAFPTSMETGMVCVFPMYLAAKQSKSDMWTAG